MPRPARIYTRAGDDGTTGLVGGARVKKDHRRIRTYGAIDELSSFVGVARAQLRAHEGMERTVRQLDEWLSWTQDVLFNLGAELATPLEKRWEGMPLISAGDVKALEDAIDEAQTHVPPLTNFIHPGGGLTGAFLHVARTVCRRAERELTSLREEEPSVSAECAHFLNRLSDALFVWARRINHLEGMQERLWDSGAHPPRDS